ncbi:MAG TPA: phosphoglucosamine mutase [Bryobacteraceae bacterium]|nr:phosphoglucosamine mutase [Bryobacteraceae bacterium]
MGKKLFGTDGIRGEAGSFPLDPPTIYAFGIALADTVRQEPASVTCPEILIGTDTRESGPWIAELVAGGITSRGRTVRCAGVITTPGVAYLTRTGPFVAGVMISASHNPFQDNGIKVFGHSGFKLPDAEEDLMEREIFRLREEGVEPRPGVLAVDEGLHRAYLDYLASTAPVRLDGLRLVIDCGNGAAYRLAPDLFRRLGAEVTVLCAEPNGRNINLNCGALHIETLRAAVLARRAHAGVAFDGDADRAIFVSAEGKTVDGDAVLLAAARALEASGDLSGRTVVATVMSNLGLEKALERERIRMVRTPVGDKYVLEEMVRLGAALGGEQSGHVIFRKYATTGDGMLTAVHLLATARKAGLSLDEITAGLEVYPQRLVNVRVREKVALHQVPSVASEIRRAEEEFAGAGRILVRYSGTEPLARVMVEGPNLAQVEAMTARIADAIRRELGS